MSSRQDNKFGLDDLARKGYVWSEERKCYVHSKNTPFLSTAINGKKLPDEDRSLEFDHDKTVYDAITEKPEACAGKYFMSMSHENIVKLYNGGIMGLFIPYDVPTFKNNKQLFVRTSAAGKAVPGSTDSKLVKEYKQVASQYYENLLPVFKSMVGKRKFPLSVRFTFIRRSAQEFDYNNICQLVQDMMKEFKWIPDDSCRYLTPNFDEGYGIDKFNPGVILKVF